MYRIILFIFLVILHVAGCVNTNQHLSGAHAKPESLGAPLSASQTEIDVKGADQPAGCPLVVELTMKNIGRTSIEWWSAGPGEYPGAEHFKVQIREGAEDQWREVIATNGQYTSGTFGGTRELKPGYSITVPLAVPLEKTGGVSFTIEPREWKAVKPAEGWMRPFEDGSDADLRRAQEIGAVITDSSPFWQHLAEQYPDPIVLDAMLKLVTVDNQQIAAEASRVLARQEKFPPNAGEIIAPLVTRWLFRPLPFYSKG